MMLLKGIEEEVYAGTPDGDILGLSPQVASALDGFVCEPDARNLEYTTSPAIEYGNVQAQLQERRDTLGRYLAENGYDLIPGSCMSLEHDRAFQHSMPGNPYHARIRELYGTDVVTTSCHININLEDPEEMIRAYRIIRMEAPLFLALSASSPFLNGKATGSHSTRWQIFPKTPKNVPLFTGYSHYCDWVQKKMYAGEMYNVRHLWVSVRPNGVQPLEKLERLELRICDQIGDLAVMLGVIALLEARVLQILEQPSLDPLKVSWVNAANREPALVAMSAGNEMAAALNSLDAGFHDWRTGEQSTVRRQLETLIDGVTPVAEAAGFADRLQPLQCVLKNGNVAQRWLRQYRAGKSIRDIIKQAIQRKFTCAVEQKCMM